MFFKIRRSKADGLFSDFIRERDDYVCQRCKAEFERPCASFHCSHFHSRSKKSVRFDPDNAVGLCYKCHKHFTKEDAYFGGPMKTKEHRSFFENRLGPERFDLLAIRANTPQKVDEKLIAIGLKAELQEMIRIRRLSKVA